MDGILRITKENAPGWQRWCTGEICHDCRRSQAGYKKGARWLCKRCLTAEIVAGLLRDHATIVDALKVEGTPCNR